MPTLLQLVHGYPPREQAGTELYASRVTAALVRRGWTVHVLAATRAPGRRQGETFEEALPGGGRLVRRVDNDPWRSLGRAERAPDVERLFGRICDELGPDLVHVQHLLYLSAHLPRRAPTVGTLHDAWGFCPRGGTLLRDGIEPCGGPAGLRDLARATEADCARCYEQWSSGYRGEQALAGAATRLGRVVPADTLHAAWKRVPERLRGQLRRTGPRATTSGEVGPWRRAVAGAFRRLDLRLAPSHFLARAARASGLGEVHHLPQGVDPTTRWSGGGALAFVGSLVPHKGAHLVAAAAERGGHRVDLFGPATDPSYAATLDPSLVRGALDPDEVQPTLARAAALVLGSTWPENAPLVVAEARAVGCPVIAPDIGGLPEQIVEGQDGFLYEAGDVDDLARALAQLEGWTPAVRPPPTFEAHIDRLVAFYEQLV